MDFSWWQMMVSGKFSRPTRRRSRRRKPSAQHPLRLEPLEERVVLSPTNVLVNNPAADSGSADTQSETSLVVGPASNVLVFFNDFVKRSQGILGGYATSNNGGASFTDQGTLTVGAQGQDPVSVRDNVSGTIYYSTLAGGGNALRLFRSFDTGATFVAPVNSAPGFNANQQLDKDWLGVDNATGAGHGNLYQVFTDFDNSGANQLNRGIFLTRSTDGGTTWTNGIAISGTGLNEGGYVVVGPDHTVYVFWLNSGSPEKILMRKSTDNGLTFGSSVTVAVLAATGNHGDLQIRDATGRPITTNAFPQAVVTASAIYVTYDDKGIAAGDKADIFFVQSTTGGSTWGTPIKVNNDATSNDQWQPAIAATPDGQHVGIFWYDRRLDPADSLIDRFGVIGQAGGGTVTFDNNFRVTDVSFPAVVGQDSDVETAYMGDYDTAVADANTFYTTWADNRLADPNFPSHAHQPDVRFAQIPIPDHLIVSAPASATAGVPFTITVTAKDPAGNTALAFAGTVLFSSTDPAAVLPAAYAFTAADNGVHTFNVTFKTARSQTLTVTDNFLHAVTGQVAVNVGGAAASHFQVTPSSSNVSAGAPFTATVTALDPFNGTATGYTGTVNLTSTDPLAPNLGSHTFTAADNGVFTFTGLVLETNGAQTLTARDSVNSGINGTAQVTVVAPVASRFQVVVPASGTVGAPFMVTVTALDAAGAVVSNYRGTIHFTSSDSTANLPADYTFTAADNGSHTFSGVVIHRAGSQSIQATDIGNLSVIGSATITFNPAAAVQLAIAPPLEVSTGVPFMVTVTALDVFGNITTGYTGTVHFTSTDALATLPADTTFTARDAGVHTFSGLVFRTIARQNLTVTDVGNTSLTAGATVSVSRILYLATGADAGGGPEVKVYDAVTLALKFDFFPYNVAFTGGVRVAVGDVNGDGIPDIVTAPGPGGGPDIRIFDGVTGGMIGEIIAYAPTFTGGVNVAVGDVLGDTKAEIILGPDASGGPDVRVFSAAGALVQEIIAYNPAFTGGVRVAAGDVNGDGKAEIITAPGSTGGPDVRVYAGTGALLQEFFAYAANFTGGVYVAAGDINGDGKADIITGAGAGGGPQVKVFSGTDDSLLQSLFAYSTGFTGGVRVGFVPDVNGDGKGDILTAAGPGGGPHVQVFDGISLSVLDSFFAYSTGFTGGVYVGGA